jgi:hypothetical protein
VLRSAPIKDLVFNRVIYYRDKEKVVSDNFVHFRCAASTEAAKVLIHHFMLFSDERITLEADEIAQILMMRVITYETIA